jgi:hypothetical protein
MSPVAHGRRAGRTVSRLPDRPRGAAVRQGAPAQAGAGRASAIVAEANARIRRSDQPDFVSYDPLSRSSPDPTTKCGMWVWVIGIGLVLSASVATVLAARLIARGRVPRELTPDRLRRTLSSPAVVAPLTKASREEFASPEHAPGEPGAAGAHAAPLPMPARTLARSIRKGQPCRWKRDRLRPETRLVRWICTECGVEAFAMKGSTPRQCRRTLRDPVL